MNLPDISHFLVIPRLRVQNANAVSSPLTHGFPSMTAFLGLMWALERQLKQAGVELPLNAVGVVCHDHQEQVNDGGFVKSFCLTRNPVDKSGKTAAIVEEGRIHLDISLVFGVNIGTGEWQDEYPAQVADILNRMRIAGGTVHPPAKPWLQRYKPYAVSCGEPAQMAALTRKLLPGFTLVARDDLLDQRLTELNATQPDATRLDAWLSLSRVNWHYQAAAEQSKGEWQNDRTGQGWIVPISVGYGALSEVYPAGTVANTRDPHTPFRFVESLYSIGQWIAPHRLTSVEQLLWYADSQSENGLYRCRNNFIKTQND
ncbi:type I-F CRISPR-associated protein Csy2 [Thalassolituus sp. ST750PaO-4]|uniref:type I-F CRISPR-associated protein Csy2 n=1 Tax=Thalassolituus sp. ST750PaO-4 TaxID=2742965 RepID=UPI001CE362C1|nr:type I-F CRISPR-associated protein Csy2 [Thalassolituus sp. ST750PaO-4]MCA6059726.1 type I-F CRISPR-associated protein Csy2 [Thalassolituus sp. ST750PaO-4]